MTRYFLIALTAVLALTAGAGCKLIYKQNVQQGNAHDQEDLDQVELGMSKKQVAYLLGTPAIQDPFHRDRWDYISLLSHRGGKPVRRLVTLVFENDLLVATDGIADPGGGGIGAPAPTDPAGPGIEEAAESGRIGLISDAVPVSWTLQLGAFNTHEEAVGFADRAREKGYAPELREKVVPGLGTRHQVRAGRYSDREEALAALRRAERELDIAGITVPVDGTQSP